MTDHWLGSLGMITVITLSLIFLSTKGYLGWFGTAFIRQMNRIHKGKRRYIAFPMMALYITFFISTLVGIEMGNTLYSYPKEEFLALMPNEIDPSLHSSFDAVKDADPEDLPSPTEVFQALQWGSPQEFDVAKKLLEESAKSHWTRPEIVNKESGGHEIRGDEDEDDGGATPVAN